MNPSMTQFMDMGGMALDLTPITGFTCKISNSGTNIFITNPSSPLDDFVGLYITLDDGSKTFKALMTSRGTGQTYGPEIATLDFTTNWSATLAATILTDDSFSTTGGAAGIFKTANDILLHALYLCSFDCTSTGGEHLQFRSSDETANDPGGLGIGTGTYRTCAFSNASATGRPYWQNSAAGITTVNSCSVKKVLTPSSQGVNLSTVTVQSGFDYNKASYTATISAS